MEPFNSMTFNTNQGRQGAPGGALFFNNSLIYVCVPRSVIPGIPTGFEIITCAPPPGQDNWTVAAPPQKDWASHWSKSNVPAPIPHSKEGLSVPLVLVDSGDSTMIFAVPGDSSVYMMGEDQRSFTRIPIQSSNGTSVRTCGATAWGNYLVLGWWNTSANMLMWDAYDVTQIPSPLNSDFTWKPDSESGALPAAFNLPSDGLGDVVSMDWFTMGGNNFYLVTSFMRGQNPVLLVTPMTGNGIAQIGEGIGYQLVTNTGGLYGVTVLRDPAGRIRLYSVSSYTTKDGGRPTYFAMAATIPTITDPFGPHSAWTQEFAGLWNYIGEGRPVHQRPVGCFVLGSPYDITDPAAGTANDVYEITLFSPDSNDSVWANVVGYGTAQQLPNYRTGSLLPDRPPNNYIGAASGIIDAPFPLPASNIQNGNYALGYKFGTVEFGVTQTDTEAHSANMSKSGGVSSTMVTSAGIGPAWDISLSAGSTSGYGHTNAVTTIDKNGMDVALDGTGVLQPHGAFFARGVVFNYSWYRLVDLQGNWVGDGPAFCSIIPTFESARSNDFEPYLVTPGDLNSYTRESINARAVALGLIQNGADYIADVIEPNAIPIGEGGQICMEYSLVDNVGADPAYVQSHDHWNESGWTFDTSVYVGVSVGLSVSLNAEFAGIGGSATVAGFTAEDLAGFELSASHSITTDKSQQLQISLQSFEWPVAVKPTDINACNFRLYYLPANQRWIQELVQVTGLKLDTNSRPWRILFVVDSYSSLDGSINYP
jgi:hypothetical protein